MGDGFQPSNEIKSMKLYLLVTGFSFLLLFAAHIARVWVEGWHVANPTFVVTTVGALLAAGWAAYLYKQMLNSRG